MPRQPRLFVDGAYYHVYSRVGRGEPVFRDDVEAESLVKILADVKRRDGLAVLAWCVMSNHYHLALRCARVPLWRSMRLIQGRFSKGFNRRRRVYGSLWQGRYKAKLVDGGRQLQQLILYVHLNPVAAGAVKNPAKYRWTGHREILGEEEPGLVDIDETLLAFGDTREAARRTYARALAAASHAPWLGEEPGRLPWWQRERGGEQLSLPGGEPRLDALGGSTAAARHVLSADEFLVAAANALDTGIPALRAPRSGRALTRQREMVAVVAVESFGVRVKDLAHRLGKNPGVVSRWANMGGERRSHDADLRERIERFTAEVRALAIAEPAEESAFVSGLGESFID
jgi:putative transposase